ncbi:MAG: hypothetical protein ACNA8R_13120 [Nitriliruptoraceae bacterium]
MRRSRALLPTPGDPGSLWRAFQGDPSIGLHRRERILTVLFEGRYGPSGGQLGGAMDGLALSRVARDAADIDHVAQ